MVRQMQPLEGKGIQTVPTFIKPNGVESEAFRTLRTSISFVKEDTQRIVATSTEPGDGKTTVLVNLAVAFAQSGKKTLLIDADMRRPGMTTLLDLKGSKGLSQILRDTRPIADSAADNTYVSGVEGLDVIPSGTRPINPAELLSSDRFSELLAWAETYYDQILVDSPPALVVSDPAIAGRLADGMLLVVRPDKNRRKMVIRTAEIFQTAKINILGVVVNHLANGSSGGYYGSAYGYEYGYGYGYGYGYTYGHGDEGEGHDGEAHAGRERGARSLEHSEP
jgi:capsular exopolysaccharide synthesis family protein